MRVAVVGHVEWIEFARVERMPVAGEIVHALEAWEEPGGGGAVAAVELARLAGDCLFMTALGNDDVGHRAHEALTQLDLRVEVAWRDEPQRRGFVHVDSAAERTITVIGDRLGPHGSDPLPWEELAGMDAVYYTAGDAGALRAAREARVLVATARGLEVLASLAVQIDALVSSSKDAGERYEPGDLDPPPLLVVRTAGHAGGSFETSDGRSGSWDPAPLPGPPADSYGAGDCFAAGLTLALGEGRSTEEALAAGARSGAECIARKGPHRTVGG